MVGDTDFSDDSGDDDNYDDSRSRVSVHRVLLARRYNSIVEQKNQKKQKKRRKANNGRAVIVENTKFATETPFVSLQPLLDLVEDDGDEKTYEDLINPLLPEYIQQRKLLQDDEVEMDTYVSLSLSTYFHVLMSQFCSMHRANPSDQ